ncbi:MAG: hypothetical protein EKK33_15330 [Bradyrhizobiaceae bacterium]|jgi:hypothetical protein|nr:MAG: hypothetical protein EKK33_15330 [Bradyrhizobiaceae bacterium]
MSIFAFHHMIPQRFADHEAFRGIDAQTFGVYSLANGIYLPVNYQLAAEMGVSAHPGGHMPLYYDAIKCVLDRIANIPEPDVRAAKIRTLMDAMRIGFNNGDLYTNVPIGKTMEEVKKGINDVIKDNEKYVKGYPDSLQRIRDEERTSLQTGQDHLPLWSAILGNSRREELTLEAIKSNPNLNVTSGNKDLSGTPFAKFAPVDDDFRVPPTTSANPADIPSPPPLFPPFLGWLNEPEGFTRNDPRFMGQLPPSSAPNPDERRLGQLPPSMPMPPPPQVLQFNSETSDLLKFSDGSLLTGPDPHNMPRDPADWPAVLGGMSLFGAAMAAPALLPLLPAAAPIVALGLLGATAARGEPAGGEKDRLSRPDPNDMPSAGNGSLATGSGPVASQAAGKPFDQAPTTADVFDDRFGHWTVTPSGIMPDLSGTAQNPPIAGAAKLENVQRLSGVNASNANSAFASGTAPVPYLPPADFNERFGSWAMPTAPSGQPQSSKPIGVFADEPSYLIPPPIFGVDGSRNSSKDAEEWFSRWIRPLLPPQ